MTRIQEDTFEGSRGGLAPRGAGASGSSLDSGRGERAFGRMANVSRAARALAAHRLVAAALGGLDGVNEEVRFVSAQQV